MRSRAMIQVDNLIPIVLNCESFSIRGTRGMGGLSGFAEHLPRAEAWYTDAVWHTTMKLDFSRYHSGCSKQAPVA